MKGFSLEQFMLRAWYEEHAWLAMLRPLSALYQQVAVSRRQRYLTSPSASWHPPVPLIVVGNITLGGTGKTPMVIWLVEHFRNQGLRVGVISRGYGAKPPALPWCIRPGQDGPEQVGDEPLLIASRCDVPVVIDPDRTRAGKYLLQQHRVDLIISDDGLQHYRMGRALELVMIDHGRGLGNARCLPEGPLREPVDRLDSVDLIVRNGASTDTPGAFAMQLQPAALVNLKSGQHILPQSWPHGVRVQAVAGIGNPERFFRTLEALSFQPETHAFADHALYNDTSFKGFDRGEPLIMTEKDAVKCAGFARGNWWYLSVEARMSPAFAAALDTRLEGAWPSGKHVSPESESDDGP